MGNKINFIRKTILLEDNMIQDIKILKEQLRLTTDTNVIRTAVNLLWKDTYKYGTDPHKGQSIGSGTIEDQAKKKVELKLAEEKVKEDMKLQPKFAICITNLGGEIETDNDGYKFCRFMQYNALDPAKDTEQVLPISQVGHYLEETSLFIPSKEAVFKNRKDVKAKFNG